MIIIKENKYKQKITFNKLMLDLNNKLDRKKVNFQLLNNKKIHSNIFKYYKQLHQRNTYNIA